MELLEMHLRELVEDGKWWVLMPFWGWLWGVKSWEQADNSCTPG